MPRILCALGVAALLGLPAGPAAALVTSHLDDDLDLIDLMPEPKFVAEGRIGNNALNGTHELDLGQDTGAPVDTENYVWTSGLGEPFTLTYDGTAVVFELGGEILVYSPVPGVTDIFVRTRAVDAGNTVVVDQLVLDGEVVGDQSSADGSASGLDILRIEEGDLNDGFVLTGRAVLTWTGSVPTQSRLAFQIKVGSPDPSVSVDAETWARVKAAHR